MLGRNVWTWKSGYVCVVKWHRIWWTFCFRPYEQPTTTNSLTRQSFLYTHCYTHIRRVWLQREFMACKCAYIYFSISFFYSSTSVCYTKIWIIFYVCLFVCFLGGCPCFYYDFLRLSWHKNSLTNKYILSNIVKL